MFKLVNEALAECHNYKDNEVNREIKQFQKHHWEQIKKDPQLNIFAEEIPTMREVQSAVHFCNLLDDYRKSIDVYTDSPEPLSETSNRELLECINYYRPYITEDNIRVLNVLENSVKRALPEHKNDVLLDELLVEAKNIAGYRKDYIKARKTTKNAPRTYEDIADYFFEKFLQNSEITGIPSSPKKLSVYSNVLNIVDCLPQEKYTRTSKYKLKIRLNKSIANICKNLGPSYYMARKNALTEIEKYENAVENAKVHRNGRRLTDDEVRRMTNKERR